MGNPIKEPVQTKVYAYLLRQTRGEWQLLVFDHVDFPEAGIQVPGVTMEPGESISNAVLREVQEETGLHNIELVEQLGNSIHDMGQYGLPVIHERNYFLFTSEDSTPDFWIGYEMDPSDGSPAPISLRFYWVALDKVPPLAGDLDEMLPILKSRIKKEAG
jgi:ADP-ribose pyrophosphatase YjhB (NUDIX family)